MCSDEVDEFFDWPKLHRHQKIFATTRARNPLTLGAVGSGKTLSAMIRTINLCSNTPYFGDLAGNSVVIGRLKRTDLEDTTMRDFFELIEPTGWIKHFDKKRYIVQLINYSEIQFVPMEDFAKFRSRNLGSAYFEQIEEIPQTTWDEIDLHRLRRTKTLTNIPMEFHSAFAVANPCENWVFDMWGENEDLLESKSEEERLKYDPELFCIHSSTYDNIENLPPDYIPNMEKKYGGRNSKKGKMFLLGLWGSTAGSVYDWDESFVNDEDIFPPLDIDTMVTLDYGWGANGVTAVGFYTVETQGSYFSKVIKYDELCLTGYPNNGIEETVESIDNLLQYHFVRRMKSTLGFPSIQSIKPKYWVIDPACKARLQRRTSLDVEESIAEAFEKAFQARGINMSWEMGNNKINIGTDRVNQYLQKGWLKINPRCVNTRKSLKNYVWGDPDRKQDASKPAPNQFDHHGDETRYGVMKLVSFYNQPESEKVETRMEKIKRKRKESRDIGRRGIDLGRAVAR